MRRFVSAISTRPRTLSFFLLLVTLMVSSGQAAAQPGASGEAPRPREIRVEVTLDPSKSGHERCTVVPEDLLIPMGTSNVTWSLAMEGSGANSGGSSAEPAMRLDSVGFTSSLPVSASESLDSMTWRATFDSKEAFPQEPYDIFIREADGTLTDCYPHVAGSTDQGGG